MDLQKYVWKEPRMPDPQIVGTQTWINKPNYRMTTFCEKCERRQKSEANIKGETTFGCKWCKHNNGGGFSCSCTYCSK